MPDRVARGGGGGCGCIGCLLVLLLLAGAIVALVQTCESPSLIQARTTISRQVLTQLGELEMAPRLVVGTREIVAETSDERTTEIAATWIHDSLRLEVGRTVTRVRAVGNRVQYIINVAELQDGDVELADGGSTLILTVDPPTVDPDMVEVQSDPAKYEVMVDKDWFHHMLSAQATIDDAHRGLRSAVLEAGSQPAALAEVRQEAKPLLEAIVRGLIPAGSGIEQVEVRFR